MKKIFCKYYEYGNWLLQHSRSKDSFDILIHYKELPLFWYRVSYTSHYVELSLFDKEIFWIRLKEYLSQK